MKSSHIATYVMPNHHSILDERIEEQKDQYVLTIHDLPPDEKPRERLLAYGPTALSLSELLAVVLLTGTRKEDVLKMTSRIMQEYGGHGVLSSTDVKVLAKDLSISVGKAAQIVACGELGRRFNRKSRNGAIIVRSAEDVFNYSIDMRNLAKEHLRGLYLNSHYQVVHDETISVGSVDANIVHPREVFRPALACAAVGVILVHNHPSGINKPSQADISITARLKNVGDLLGINLIDHVIVTQDSFISIQNKKRQ